MCCSNFLVIILYICGHLMPRALSQEFLHPSGRRIVPAIPKGNVPPCVTRPGQTFCENISDYPYDLILNAIRKSPLDILKLLVDESTDESPNFYPLGYEGQSGTETLHHRHSSSGGQRTFDDQLRHPEMFNVFGPPRDRIFNRVNRPSRQTNPSTSAAPDSGSQQHQNESIFTALDPESYRRRYSTIFDDLDQNTNNFDDPQSPAAHRHRDSDIFDHLPHSEPHRHRNQSTFAALDSGPHRHRRQDDFTQFPREPLCKFAYRYVYPQLAMCGTGDWLYVVNMQDLKRKFTQMIRVEVCHEGVEGEPCMGDCASNSLPLGIQSRCEQQYLQKRLLTVTNEEEVFTSMFWLPTACVCKTYHTSA